MSPRLVLGRENVPWVAEVVNRSLKAACTDFTISFERPEASSLTFTVPVQLSAFHYLTAS